jgi:mono/diheme cytochrome c family protein
VTRVAWLAIGMALLGTGCGEPSKSMDPLAERGRLIFVAQCTQCHATDPAQAGPVGPPVKGVSTALLEAKIVRGEYPAGYTPKRPTRVMPATPSLAPEIPALAAYLR